jgi:octaprenyl-diphosphate synthase
MAVYCLFYSFQHYNLRVKVQKNFITKHFFLFLQDHTPKMKDLNQIKQPVETSFDEFIRSFEASLTSNSPTITKAVDTIRRSEGKYLRPLIVLLTAQACGNVTSLSIDAAVWLELLHTASLIHDDVVDDTKQRRGAPSLNAVYDNRIAVLVGDYIFTEAFDRAMQSGMTDIIRIMTKISREMTEGEIKQLENTNLSSDMTEADYFAALEKKTAMLLSACAEIGAITSGASLSVQDCCQRYGRWIGFCFQIRDDVFDYFDTNITGKPSGNDLREGKITLPLLYALNTATETERNPYIQMIRNCEFTPDNITMLTRFAKDKGGVEYAKTIMNNYKKKAVDALDEIPPSDAKDNLIWLADYIVERLK